MYYYSPYNSIETKPLFTDIFSIENDKYEVSMCLFEKQLPFTQDEDSPKCVKIMLFELKSDLIHPIVDGIIRLI